MNEVAMLRAQLATERAHLLEVASACAAAAAVCAAHHDYLTRTLRAFALRDERLAQLARARAPLAQALAQGGSSHEALARLPPAAADARAWQAFAHYLLGAWSVRRERLETLLAQESGAADWRTVAGLDAEAILEERTRFARARAVSC
jgi:hypothetical protein